MAANDQRRAIAFTGHRPFFSKGSPRCATSRRKGLRLSLSQKIASIVVLLSLPALGLFLAGLDRARTDIRQLSQAMAGHADIRTLLNASQVASATGTTDLALIDAIGTRPDVTGTVRDSAAKLAESQRTKPSVPRFVSGVASLIHDVKIPAGLQSAVDGEHAALPGIVGC